MLGSWKEGDRGSNKKRSLSGLSSLIVLKIQFKSQPIPACVCVCVRAARSSCVGCEHMLHETPVDTHMDSHEDLKDSYENEGRVQEKKAQARLTIKYGSKYSWISSLLTSNNYYYCAFGPLYWAAEVLDHVCQLKKFAWMLQGQRQLETSECHLVMCCSRPVKRKKDRISNLLHSTICAYFFASYLLSFPPHPFQFLPHLSQSFPYSTVSSCLLPHLSSLL